MQDTQYTIVSCTRVTREYSETAQTKLVTGNTNNNNYTYFKLQEARVHQPFLTDVEFKPKNNTF